MNNYNKYEVEANKYYLDIKFNNDKENAFKTLEELYRYVKSIQNDYLINGEVDKYFSLIFDRIYLSEEVFNNNFIISSNPNFQINEFDYYSPIKDKEERLRWIIHMTRKDLSFDYPEIKGNIETRLQKASMRNRCTKSSNIIHKYCEKYDINSKRFIIYPGFTKNPSLYDGYKFHGFNIINIYGKNYIVDLTYRQFFTEDQSSLERIGIFNLTGTLPGTFMLMNESRKKTALKLLKDGYIEMTEENIKNYFDGFAISFRNGTFYEVTDDYSYTTSYSPNDYIRFINGEDSQYNYEGMEVLGFQKRRLRENNSTKY